jgi:hypothetical protein
MIGVKERRGICANGEGRGVKENAKGRIKKELRSKEVMILWVLACFLLLWKYDEPIVGEG